MSIETIHIGEPIILQAVLTSDPDLIVLRGYSAYEVAVRNGFEGTETEWLASLAEQATIIALGYANEAEGAKDIAVAAKDDLLPILNDMANLLAVSAKLAEIDLVEAHLSEITILSSDLDLGENSKISVLSANISSIQLLDQNIDSINRLSDDLGEGINSNIKKVSESINNVDTVAGSISNVNNVGGSIADVNSVAGKLTEVETVSGDLTNIDTVAAEISDVGTVANNIADVKLAADNIVAIQAAPTYAEEAEKWAVNPEDSPVETGKYSALHHSEKASASQTAAEAARDKASDWAEEDEDVEVETGQYSAKHWAAKAEDVVDEAYTVVENKIDKTAVKQETGASTTDVMSQKAVTDELAQLAGDVSDSTEKAGAASLAELNARLLALEKIVSATITHKLEVTKEFNVWGKTNLILIGSGAATFAPDFIGQKYIDTAGGNVYVAVGVATAGNWKLV